MKKVYVVGNNIVYGQWITNSKLVDNIEEADIVVFTGGEDVDPSFYNKPKHPTTYSNVHRDEEEINIFKKIKSNQLVVGICRGSQLMCILNGGNLIQDCTNHAIGSTHAITDGTFKYEITSTHHQMQYPYNLNEEDYTIIFTALSNRSNYYRGYDIDSNILLEKGEPEVVLYHTKNKPVCLAIQGHPEYMRENAPIVKKLNQLINDSLKSIKNK